MKVIYKDIKGYWAMNHYAGEQLNLPKKDIPSKNTIFMNHSVKRGSKRFNEYMGHEKFEIHNLRDRHMKYAQQESYTNKFERNMK